MISTPRIAVAALLLLPLAVSPAEARRWYDNKWVWGGTGLLAGGIVGYALGHEHSHPTYYYPQPTYYTPYTYAPAPAVAYHPGAGGGQYFKETRVWPFYRRTESYPIAATAPISVSPQAVSYGDAMRAERQADTTPQGVTINVGDNNSNVTVNFGGATGGSERPGANRVYVIENNVAGAGRRVIDMRGKQVIVMPETPAADNPPPQPRIPEPVEYVPLSEAPQQSLPTAPPAPAAEDAKPAEAEPAQAAK